MPKSRTQVSRIWQLQQLKELWLYDPKATKAGVVNNALSKAVPQACWSEGVLVRVEPLFIVLASSQFIDDGKDPEGDYTAIVRGCITSIKRRK